MYLHPCKYWRVHTHELNISRQPNSITLLTANQKRITPRERSHWPRISKLKHTHKKKDGMRMLHGGIQFVKNIITFYCTSHISW